MASFSSNYPPKPEHFHSFKYGEFGVDGKEEMNWEPHENLLGIDTIEMVHQDKLEKELCVNALIYLVFLKQKQMRKIKVRRYADSIPQQEYIGKDKASLPIVSIYMLLKEEM